MSWLRSALFVVSSAGIVVAQLSTILPEGKARSYVTAAGIFLTGLAVNAEPLLSNKQAPKVGQ